MNDIQRQFLVMVNQAQYTRDRTTRHALFDEAAKIIKTDPNHEIFLIQFFMLWPPTANR